MDVGRRVHEVLECSDDFVRQKWWEAYQALLDIAVGSL